LKQQKRVQPAPQGRNQEAARSAANEVRKHILAGPSSPICYQVKSCTGQVL
jgi:hypothetical protein